ncbi:SH3 domain-containing protein [Mucilaginibacter gracilis]|uniref:SH3 domain-containing protein n=1 Tax=Mucilaginibacter gracilis TaxID=423350 RepID=A0A495J3Z4_9SPHI|nr:C40 family peptidase [Mucilaginibacter gracilis]RKR82719.1 SH3 domain-containing protein [Mucilaginibacter gracilis]
MEYGICNLAIVPLRADAAHRSEMVSQLLFGETFEIVEHRDDWVRVMTSFDGYEGWLSKLQYAAVTADDVSQLSSVPAITTRAIITAARKEDDNTMLYLPFGSTLPFYNGADCRLAGSNYNVETSGNLDALIETAYSFLNTPYLWGGRSHFGIDCSGYVQAVLRTQRVVLKRDASLQAAQGTLVDFLQGARLGDLAFFDNAEGHIIHVGIMLDNQSIIHASGRVKIDKIDDQGIYSVEQKKYTHKLRIIKRFI